MNCRLENNKLILDLKNKENEILRSNTFLKIQDDGRYEIQDEFFQKVSGKFVEEKKEDSFNIIILLESPHKNEYEYEYKCDYSNKKVVKITPRGSAQGHTGRKISRNIDKIKELSRKILKLENIDCNFYILNPVPYQTSLHAIIRSKKIDTDLRDEVFTEIFNNNFKNCKTEFFKELKAKDPKLILNCCTKKLKGIVEKAIDEQILNCKLKNKKVKIFSNLYHPSARKFKGKLDEEIKKMR
ncbi:MAG: hypothetical protein ACRCZI_08155 [Cetobacterium sp.]